MVHWALSVLLTAAHSLADCPFGSIYDNNFNKCYKFFTSPLAFLAAEQQCNSIGGHLTDVQNAFENSYIAGVASGATSKAQNFWIGANLMRSSSWTWMNGSMVYSNWDNGQPANSNPCAFVKDNNEKWGTLSCNTALPFICAVNPNWAPSDACPPQTFSSTMAPTTSSSTVRSFNPSPPTGGCSYIHTCEDDFLPAATTCLCYKYFEVNATFSEANAICAKYNGTLAKSTSEDVNWELVGFSGDCDGFSCPHIGLNCTDGVSNCSWADGTPLGNFRNFAYNNYNFSSTYALATHMGHRDAGKWEPQNDSRYFLCERGSIRQATP